MPKKEKTIAPKKKIVRKKVLKPAVAAEVKPVEKVHVEKVHKVKAKIEVPKYWGTGRRKTAVARVYLSPGTGKILVNGRPFESYICGRKILEVRVLEPLRLTQTLAQYNVKANIFGGGISSQMDALRQGISRALVSLNPALRPVLRRTGLLTRDPRMKERKKYGRKRARKRFQYSKR